jgi:hypothetical protein
VQPPSRYGWSKADDGVGETQEFKSSADLTEYRDGVLCMVKDGVHRGIAPVLMTKHLFHSEATGGMFKGLKVTIDQTEIFIHSTTKMVERLSIR